ncbi:MAG: phosphatase PAP2 family protein [Bacteroidota bacterium]|jgi:undecaprenyl-diphosphatase|nr:phosphatase PAP2 family protein [Bacteroidota bacterium]
MHQLLSLSFWQRLEKWDQWLFIQLNSHFTNPFFDAVLPYFRNSAFWAPLYIFILIFIVINYGKKGLWWGIGFLCTVAIADLVGARVFKEGFERLRPCQDPAFFQYVRLLLKHCSGSYSFISNHAANHFGMATFVSITFFPVFKKWIFLFYLWAAFIGYAQIYVGVHYPLDVLGGAVVGSLAGLLTATIFTDKAGSFTLHK